jgi:thiol-disulfide isomerase/thioredoxin
MKPSLVALLGITAFIVGLLAITYLGLNAEGFADKVVGKTNSRGTFTMYYADWCPHCQTAKPMFVDFMGPGVLQVNGQDVKVKMVEEKQIQKGVDPEVKGYPSFLYSDAAGKVVEYSGPRSPDGFMKFLETKILS